MLCVDASGRVIGANGAAAEVLGRPRDAILESTAAELLAPPENEPGLPLEITRALADTDTGAAPASRRVERAIATFPGHARRWLEASITRTEFDGERIVTLFLRDLTDAKRTEKRRAVEHRLARVLAAARSEAEIARGTLEMIATGLDFDHAELWRADDLGATLRLSVAWRRRSEGPFGESGRQLILGRGNDLAGMAWEIGETVCLDDASAVEGLLRHEAIAVEGIRGAAALPMRVGASLAGVVVLARGGGEPLDPELRQTLHSIAVQLGHFSERRVAERRLAEETVALAAVARATRTLTGTVDATTAIQAICDAALEVSGAAYSFLSLPDPEHGSLVVRSWAPSGPADPDPGERFAPQTSSAVLRAYQTREVVHLSDSESLHPVGGTQATNTAVVSGLLQPLARGDEALGVLGLGWTTRQGVLDRSLRMLVRLLANEAAMALTRVDLVARLESAARTDPLTGLANLRAWEEQLSRELATAKRHGRPVVIALLDLDGFKALNDELGHLGGDRVLRESAAAWEGQLRKGDLLARLGGDEFAALLPGCEIGHALHLADRLRSVTPQVTASVGVSSWLPEESARELMMRADAALYDAKTAGRDRVSSG